MSEDKKARPGKLYTYEVMVFLKLQHTFTEDEVEQDPEGAEGDLCPPEDVIDALAEEILEELRPRWMVTLLEAEADSDNLIGVDEAIPNE